MICDSCNKEINDNIVYCRYCGKKHNASTLDILDKNLNTSIDLVDENGFVICNAFLGALTERPDWRYYTKRGGELIEEGEYREALEYCERALELEKNEPLIYLRRGLCYNELGETKLALLNYNQAISINPSYLPALVNRSVIYLINGQYVEAINDCTRVLKEAPSNLNALNNMAWAKMQIQDFQGAQIDILKVLHEIPSDPSALYILGFLQLKLGETKDGIKNLKKSAEKGFQLSIELLNDIIGD